MGFVDPTNQRLEREMVQIAKEYTRGLMTDEELVFRIIERIAAWEREYEDAPISECGRENADTI